ncbi:hypothetical protein [Schumannella soli]|uniref:Uncharacterized protein n=1 Tax=Schumannella soli TaxID=2590779 RepID=A0A506Y2C2_9MICO|nr:hypothetical protein [Schumannella soli]TPW76053.1 hypothetical protein FJ657_09530 [Schumannella soli]
MTGRPRIAAGARRHLLAGGVAVASGGMLASLLFFEPFLPGAPAATPVHRVARGDTAEVEGSGFRIGAAGFFTAESDQPVDVPAGYAVLGVLVPITPGSSASPDPGSCDIVLVAPGGPGGVDREWTSEVDPGQYDYGTTRGTRSICQFGDDGEKVTYEGVFLVPDDVYAAASLEIRFTSPKSDGYARSVYRFALPADPVG